MIDVGQCISKSIIQIQKVTSESNIDETKSESVVIIDRPNTLQSSAFSYSYEKKLNKSFLSNAVELYCALGRKSTPELLDKIINNLINSTSIDINQYNWIDCSLALYIIGECAKLNLKALNLFLNMSKGYEDLEDQSTYFTPEFSPRKSRSGLENWMCEIACVYADILADICVNASHSSIKRKALLGSHNDAAEIFNNKKPETPSQNQKPSSFGLIDLAKFQIKNPPSNKEGKINGVFYC